SYHPSRKHLHGRNGDRPESRPFPSRDSEHPEPSDLYHRYRSGSPSCKALHQYPGCSDKCSLATCHITLVCSDFGLERWNLLGREVDRPLGDTLVSREVQGVYQPVLIVPIRVVVAAVCTAAFLALLSCDGGRFSNLQQVVELKSLNPRSVVGLALVCQVRLTNPLAQLSQFAHALLHQVALAEYAKVVLHVGLQLFAQNRNALALLAVVQTIDTAISALQIGFARLALLNTFFQRLLDIQTGSTTEHHQIQQRVTAQTVGTVYRYAGNLAYREQSGDDFVIAIGILGQRLTMNIGRDTTHHVVARRHHRNRFLDRVSMGKRDG